ncbi:hypothetical protein LR48_Vigan550s000100 [Vigna angularis]|uniref:Uncharacterized protein n=1 Tax=Phaseolus angularis TaxID=3914 RepID=A0A0L9TEI5_PHAAN|nr:hypothetical protein LR48_Vigan550s000100 [Vigna angularis]
MPTWMAVRPFRCPRHPKGQRPFARFDNQIEPLFVRETLKNSHGILSPQDSPALSTLTKSVLQENAERRNVWYQGVPDTVREDAHVEGRPPNLVPESPIGPTTIRLPRYRRSPPLRIKRRVKAREEDPPRRQDRRRIWRFGTAQPYTSETLCKRRK